MTLKKIVMVEACDMPEDVLDYCVDKDWQTHYQNDIVYLHNDGNPFAEWLKANGYIFEEKCGFDYIGINAT